MALLLPQKNNIVLDHRYFLGDFQDYSGNSNTGVPTGSSCIWKKRGDTHLGFKNTGRLVVSDSSELQLTSGSIIVYGEFNKYNNSSDRIVSKRDGSGTAYDWYFLNSTDIQVYDGTFSGTATINWMGSKFLGITFSPGEKYLAYKDGVYVAQANTALTFPAATADVCIGNVYSASVPMADTLKGVLIWNVVLSAAEMATVYEWCESVHSIHYPKRHYSYPSKLTGRENGLVSSWKGEFSNGVLSDLTGSNNLTQHGYPLTEKGLMGNALSLNGTNAYFSVSDNDSQDLSQGTIMAWIKTPENLSSYHNIAIKSRAYALLIYANYFGVFDWDAVAFRSSGVTINDNHWHHVAFVFDNGVTNGSHLYVDGELKSSFTYNQVVYTYTLQIGADSASQYFKGLINEVRLYDEILSGAEITKLYQEGAKIPYLLDTCEDYNISTANETSGRLSNSIFNIYSGSWKIEEDTTFTYNKTLSCQSTGAIYTPSSQAYGQWELEIRTEKVNNSAVGFISSHKNVFEAPNNGYVLFWSSGLLYLGRISNGGYATTIDGPIDLPINNTYKVKITRNLSGLFKVYLKEDNNWTEILSGTNTSYTSSKYFSIYVPEDYKVGNIKIYNGIVG